MRGEGVQGAHGGVRGDHGGVRGAHGGDHRENKELRGAGALLSAAVRGGLLASTESVTRPVNSLKPLI